MTTAAETQKTRVQVSPEVKAIHQRMLRRHRLTRALTYLVGILISLWVLIPIWFIASMALTTPAEVRSYPKGILPFIPFSFDTMEFFLNSRGILPGLRNSLIVAVITLIPSILIAAPAGYALSRFPFRQRSFQTQVRRLRPANQPRSSGANPEVADSFARSRGMVAAQLAPLLRPALQHAGVHDLDAKLPTLIDYVLAVGERAIRAVLDEDASLPPDELAAVTAQFLFAALCGS